MDVGPREDVWQDARGWAGPGGVSGWRASGGFQEGVSRTPRVKMKIDIVSRENKILGQPERKEPYDHVESLESSLSISKKMQM